MAEETFDYIVVGSGSAGGVLAARLTEDPTVRVLLLEAGPEDDDDMIRIPAGFSSLFKTRWDWNYWTTPQEHLAGRRADWPRMKALGGCSSMNAMIYIRGNRADYDGWRDDFGARGWGYEDVLPYFVRSESNARLSGPLHGTSGPLRVEDRRFTHELSEAFVESAARAGLARNEDFNGPTQEGAGQYQVTHHRGRRWSVADAYIRPARPRRNLTIRTEAFVTRILLDSAGPRATGVEYERFGAVERVRAEAEVLLCGGAINSPQVLMLSGIGPGEHLREHGIEVLVDSPGVGKGLQDHPVAGTLIETQGTSDLAEAQTLGNLARWQTTRRGPLVSNVGEAGAFFASHDGLAHPDIQIHVAPTGFYHNGIHEPVRRMVTIAPTLVDIHSRGRLRLRSADPHWHPEIDPGYFTDRRDLDAMVGGFRRVLDIVWQGPLARYLRAPVEPSTTDPSDDDLIEVIARLGQTLYHPTSTCAMGSGGDSVVDSGLRVRGVEGLRVVDASVMPRVVRGNTHAPTVMIAEKASDLIRSGT
ncbi:choline dehydrogenase [Aeromicrobium sp. PE09-221]|uniref:GMC family oxidoreductase n=1 Tax=Aeromicrobium sp. PE09-221 TaxID=1898043 RepID=UPI000B6432BB|nr:GMC family oxidoreductase N-terminal domain-containing protein [Aeromicrobium sp. PE09-221]OUZ07853.1 choline dehydrogenase [Aeromicrobium sp. PE09-221]